MAPLYALRRPKVWDRECHCTVSSGRVGSACCARLTGWLQHRFHFLIMMRFPFIIGVARTTGGTRAILWGFLSFFFRFTCFPYLIPSGDPGWRTARTMTTLTGILVEWEWPRVRVWDCMSRCRANNVSLHEELFGYACVRSCTRSGKLQGMQRRNMLSVLQSKCVKIGLGMVKYCASRILFVAMQCFIEIGTK